MTAKLFNRTWKIKAQSPDGEVREWVDIDFEASVVKTEHEEPNETTLTIYNLSKDSRAFLSKKGTTIEISAGYKDTSGVISKGQIDTVTSKHDGTTWATEIQILDGARAARNVKISETFKAGTAYQSIFNKLIDLLTAQTEEKEIPPLKRGNIDLSAVTGNINSAMTLKDLAIDRFSQLCKSFNLRWYVIDGALYTAKSNLSIANDLIELNPGSGLIGRPEQTEKGYKLMSLLRHEFQPGLAFLLKSESLESRLIIRMLTHTAATRGDFTTELECEIFG